MSSSILDKLNSKQKQAAAHISGASIILAGAGSGKTKTIVHKVAHLIQDHSIRSDNIVMITFTNKAGNEMKERINQMFDDNVKLGYVGTFHSFCCYLLRRNAEKAGLENNFSIYDADDQQSVLKSILKEYQNNKYSPKYFSSRISTAKNLLIEPQKYTEIFADYKAEITAEIYAKYQKRLIVNNALDFDDLIMRTVKILANNENILQALQNRFKYLFVDEFQDTNHAQYQLTKLLGRKHQNVTVVGDFSQSIYSWRGAEIQNLQKFETDFNNTKTIQLDQNYRSTQFILDLAYKIISQNRMHPILHLKTDNKTGEDVTFQELKNEEAEAKYIISQIQNRARGNDYSDFAILYRINAQSRALEEALLHEGIPYVLIGGMRFYERKEIKDILAYLRLIVNPTDELSLTRVKKLGKRRWEKFKKTYQKLSKNYSNMQTIEVIDDVLDETGYLAMFDANNPEEYSRLENIRELKSVAISFPSLIVFLEQVSLVESEYFQGEKDTQKGVKLMTLHQAKGLEFSVVFIAGLEEGILPHSRSIDDSYQLEEERRLFYVGITRAKEKLYITYSKWRYIYGSKQISLPSQFIQDFVEYEYNSF